MRLSYSFTLLAFLLMPVWVDAHSIPSTHSSSFISNEGQITDRHNAPRTDIQFKLEGAGVNVFIGNGQLHYQWARQHDKTTEIYRMDVSLLGADHSLQPVKEALQTDYDVYFFGGEASGTICRRYGRITYKNIYPGIDWVLYATAGGLKYDFVLAPGADPSVIRLQFEGATTLQLRDGNLVAGTPMGTLTEQAPYSYTSTTRQEVRSAFVLNKNVLSFDIAANAQQLVIDPTVQWATYYGGAGNESGGGVTTDEYGNVFLCGGTVSTNNIATSGTFQTSIAQDEDGFVTKFNAAGQRQWGTYLGGYGAQKLYEIEYGKNGEIFIAGYTDSTNMMTAGAHQVWPGDYGLNLPNNGPYDVLFVKIDPAGQRLWATYYGGSEDDYVEDLSIDTTGDVYICGKSYSPNNMGTAGTFQPNVIGGRGFLAKFNAAGQRQWGTYHGGTYVETYAVHADAQGGVYIAGTTGSTTNIATAGAFQPAPYGEDGYLVKFNASNGTKLWGTYYGGATLANSSSYPITPIHLITGDASGNVYIAGQSNTTDQYPAGSHQATYGGGSHDGFIAKFNNAGQIQWRSYYGGSNYETIKSMRIDMTGNLLVAGRSASINNMTTANAAIPIFANSTGDFIARFTPAGQRLYGSFINCPSCIDGPEWIDGYSNLYEARPWSISGLATAGSHQSSLSGNDDIILTKLSADPFIMLWSNVDTLVCAGDSFSVTYIAQGNYQAGNNFTVQLSDNTGSFASPVTIGTLADISATGTILCVMPAGTTAGTGYRIRVAASTPAVVSDNNGYNITVSTSITPSVTVAIAPSLNVGPYTPVTFTATPAGGGSSPTYQWKKNGTNIPGATGNVYSAVAGIDITTGDAITVQMKSNATCAGPEPAESNSLTMTVNLSINELAAGNGIRLNPNPNSGRFTLTSNAAGNVKIEVLDIAGRIIYSSSATSGNGVVRTEIQLDGKIPSGIYVLRLISATETGTITFSLQR